MVVSWTFLVEDEDKKKMMIIRNTSIKNPRRNAIVFVLVFSFFFLFVVLERVCECDFKLPSVCVCI